MGRCSDRRRLVGIRSQLVIHQRVSTVYVLNGSPEACPTRETVLVGREVGGGTDRGFTVKLQKQGAMGGGRETVTVGVRDMTKVRN